MTDPVRPDLDAIAKLAEAEPSGTWYLNEEDERAHEAREALPALLAWIEHLEAEAERNRPMAPVVMDELGRLRDRGRRLETALRDACELAREGWAYAGDYFNSKWESNARIAECQAVLESSR